jgi:hypothetical protein
MKKHLLSLCVILFLAATVPNLKARVVTLMLTTANQTNQITIEAFESVKISTFWVIRDPYCTVTISKGGSIMYARPGELPLPFVLAGPAVISFYAGSPDPLAVLTLEITPEAYPPDKSITLAPGTGGAEITLQCSTNLVNWSPALNGVYTNLDQAKFFRIKADRMP